jgi:hypothetical protein
MTDELGFVEAVIDVDLIDSEEEEEEGRSDDCDD